MRRVVLFLWLVLGSPLSYSMSFVVESTGDVIEIPDHWRPIPRAEIEEVETLLRSKGIEVPPMMAAFQQLPTLQWFRPPLLTLRSNVTCVLPERAGAWRELDAESAMTRQDGPVTRMIAFRRVAARCYDLEYLSPEPDEPLFMAMVRSLHAPEDQLSP